MKYDGVYSCGHAGVIDICGPTKDRKWKIDHAFSRLCPECYKKEKEEKLTAENAEAARKASEMELPELIGTDKQIAWANTLRIKVIERCEDILKKYGDKASDSQREEVISAMDNAIRVHTDAKFWIESRDDHNIFRVFMEEYKESKGKENIPEGVKEELRQEEQALTVLPNCENKKSGIVVINYDKKESFLSLKYPKDENFREIVKSLGYTWSGEMWRRKITEYTGSSSDRAAEIGNALLLDGFAVQFPDLKSKEMAVAADFAPENDRWVKLNIKTGNLALVWRKKSDILYDIAKKLPGARWKDGGMLVNIEFYQEVIDFVETMGFSISKAAREAIQKYKEKESGFELASVAVHEEIGPTDEERLSKTLRASGTIIEDLKDEA